MERQVLKILNATSAVMLVITILLFLAGFVFNPWDHYLSFNNNSHVGIWGCGCDSRIVFFNDREYGPYRGSIIGFADADGNVYPPLERNEAFGDSWGIYYRYFEWSDSKL